VRKYTKPLTRWLLDPQLARSPLLFALGVLIALAALWLRESTLFSEPTIGQDDVLCFAAQYGEGAVLYHHSGAVHVLPMLSSWAYARILPESLVPYSLSLTSLLLAAIAPATLLLPAMERWLPLLPQRGLAFLLWIALPLDTAFLVASMAYQHLHYLLIAFLMLAFSAAPRAAPWFELSSPLKLGAFCAVFALVASSAPLSLVLVPLPLHALLRSGSKARPTRQQLISIFAVLFLLVYGLFGIGTEHAFVLRANLLENASDLGRALELLWHFAVLLIDRVFFETFFGTSSRLWLSNRLGIGWAVTLLGAMSAALVLGLFAKRRRQTHRENSGAGYALYAVIALPLFALLGRWHLHDAEAWHRATFRYFVPSAKVLVLALVILTTAEWARVRGPRLLMGALLVWILALNLLDNPRYGGAVASVLTANSSATSLHDLGREDRRVQSRLTVREFAAIEQLARTLAPGERRAYTFERWDTTVTVRGRGSDRP